MHPMECLTIRSPGRRSDTFWNGGKVRSHCGKGLNARLLVHADGKDRSMAFETPG